MPTAVSCTCTPFIRVLLSMKLVCFFVLFLLAFSTAHAADFVVNNTGDSGAGTLREAIISANTGIQEPHRILFDASLDGQTITLQSSLPAVITDMEVNVMGGPNVIINGQGQHSVFHVGADSGGDIDVILRELTIIDGLARGGDGGNAGRGGTGGGGAGLGGGLFVDGNAAVTLVDTRFSNNQAIGGNAAPSTGTNNRGGGGGGGRFADGQNAPGDDGAGGGGPNAGTGGSDGGGGVGSAGTAGGLNSGGGGGGGGTSGGGSGGAAGFGGAGAGGGGATSGSGGGAGGSGGFGGGGGGGGATVGGPQGSGGSGGYGGGNGQNGSTLSGRGGGGAGFGGAVFVREGGTLSIINGEFENNTAAGGAGGNDGLAAGGELFLMGGGPLSFTVDAGLTTTIEDSIASDDTPMSLDKTGAGILVLAAESTFDGGVTVSEGVLQLDAEFIMGSIDIASGASLLITGIVDGDVADFVSLDADATLVLGDSPGTLVVGGDYSASNDTTLGIPMTPDASSRLEVGGSALQDGGTVTVSVASGSYDADAEYPILVADDGFIGTFDTLEQDNPDHPMALVYDDHGAYLRVVSYDLSSTVTGGNGSVDPEFLRVAHGAGAQVQVTPDIGWSTAAVTGDTCTPTHGGGGIWEVSNLTEDCQLAASFVINEYTVTASVAGGNGAIGPPAQQIVEHGGSATFELLPDTGWQVASFAGDTCTPTDNGDGTWTIDNVTADCELSASFVINEYSVTATVGGGNGSIDGPAQQTVPHGGSATFELLPDPNWQVASFTGDTCVPTNIGGDTWTIDNVTDDCQLSVHFELNEYTVVATVASGNGAIDGPAEQTVSHGDSVTFDLLPDEGWHVASFNGDTCVPVDSGDNAWTVDDVTDDCQLSAIFEINEYTLVASVASGNGAIDGPAEQTVSHGDSVTFDLLPDEGWHVASFNGDTCTPVNSGDDTWTVEAVTDDCQLSAIFEINEYTLVASVADGNGAIDGPAEQTVSHGDSVTFGLLPDEGWHVASFNGDTCVPVDSGDDTWTVDDVTDDCQLSAIFEINEYTLVASVASGNGAIDGPAEQTVSHGDSVTFDLLPDDGWHVASFTGDTCTPTDDGDDIWTVDNVSEDCQLSATFELSEYTVTATVTGGNGSIDGSSQQSVSHGGSVSLELLPDDGWQVDSVTGDTCQLVEQSDNIWMVDEVTDDCDVSVTFVEQAFSLLLQISGSGTITVEPEQSGYNLGEEVTLTAAPDPGWEFAGWNVDPGTVSHDVTDPGSDFESVDNPLMLIVTGDVSVQAEFQMQPAIPVPSLNRVGLLLLALSLLLAGGLVARRA